MDALPASLCARAQLSERIDRHYEVARLLTKEASHAAQRAAHSAQRTAHCAAGHIVSCDSI